MHAALLVNSAWLDDEFTTFQQLTVGLIDEQVRLTRVVPRSAEGPGLGDTPLFGRRLTWPESRVAAINHRRLVRLAAELDAEGVTLLHALHRDLWPPAAVIGDQLDLPVVFSVQAEPDAAAAGRLARQLTPGRCVFAATTQPLAELTRDAVAGLVPVEHVPPGVHVGEPRDDPPDRDGRAPCLAVCGDGVMDDAYRQLLIAVRDVVDQRPDVQLFFDGQRTDQHQVWKAAQKLALLPNLSFVPRRHGHREMLLMADAMVHPQRLGRSRAVTLSAMAHGVPVLAAADPVLDYLLPDRTAWVLDDPAPGIAPAPGTGPDAEAWAGLILRAVDDPDAARALGRDARAWVRDHRLASDQIARVLSLYRQATGEPLPFPG
ncbi:MAG: glycosyltransferase family 4 protein [Planctomycetota bacterium]